MMLDRNFDTNAYKKILKDGVKIKSRYGQPARQSVIQTINQSVSQSVSLCDKLLLDHMNRLNAKIDLNYIQRPSPYRAVNKRYLNYKN
jgi:hypothetical protein